jgi:large repetitive protein
LKKKFALIFALALVAAGVFAATASALHFDNGDCVESGPGAIWICPTGQVDAGYSATLKGSGGCGPALPYQYRVLSGALPPGISLSSSGVFSGRPTTAGTYEFYLELSDENPPSQPWCIPKTAERQFRISIDPGLSISKDARPVGTVGVPYSNAIAASLISSPDSTQPATNLTWSVISGALPPGINLASDGVLSGTPTAEGSSTFTVKATDGSRSDTETFTIIVRTPVAITPIGLHQWGLHGSEVGIPLSTKLTATGGTGTFTWTLSAGALPTGLVLGTDGTISGRPRLAGKFPFTVQVADSEGRTATVSTTLTVAAKLSFKTLTLRAAKVGRLYNAKLVTLGGVTPVKWTVLRGTLPRGIHFAKKLGMFTGTPKREGTYRVTVQAVDGYGIKTQKTFVLVVKA